MEGRAYPGTTVAFYADERIVLKFSRFIELCIFWLCAKFAKKKKKKKKKGYYSLF